MAWQVFCRKARTKNSTEPGHSVLMVFLRDAGGVPGSSRRVQRPRHQDGPRNTFYPVVERTSRSGRPIEPWGVRGTGAWQIPSCRLMPSLPNAPHEESRPTWKPLFRNFSHIEGLASDQTTKKDVETWTTGPREKGFMRVKLPRSKPVSDPIIPTATQEVFGSCCLLLTCTVVGHREFETRHR